MYPTAVFQTVHNGGAVKRGYDYGVVGEVRLAVLACGYVELPPAFVVVYRARIAVADNEQVATATSIDLFRN